MRVALLRSLRSELARIEVMFCLECKNYLNTLCSQVHSIVIIIIGICDCKIWIIGTRRSHYGLFLKTKLETDSLKVLLVRKLTSLKKVEKIVCKEWHSISLDIVQDLYESIPKRIQAVFKANGALVKNILIKTRLLFPTSVYIQMFYLQDTKRFFYVKIYQKF